MLSDLSAQLDNFLNLSRHNIPTVLYALAMLWVINILNWLCHSPVNQLGIRPRKISGLIGILIAPIAHQNFNHLFFNSIPLFFLSLLLLSYSNSNFFYAITALIIFWSGLGIWLFGRRGVHIGASALITGYFSALLFYAYERPNIIILFCAGIVIYYFGSIALSIFPSEEQVSWEGHLIGFIAGILSIYLLLHYHNFLLQFFTS